MSGENYRAETHKVNGNNYFKRKEYDNAIKEYTAAINQNPRNAVYYTNRALCYLKLKKYDSVVLDCESAIRQDKRSVKGHYMLGQALTEKGEFELAIFNLQKAYDLDKDKFSYSGEIIQALLSARKKKWEREERIRVQRESEFLKYIKGLINAERDRQLQKVSSKSSMAATFSKCRKSVWNCKKRSFVSKIPGFYARMTTCIMKSRGQDLVWIGTEQNQVLCFKDDDAKPKWGTFISGTSLLMTEVLLDKRNAGFESTLIVQTTDGRRVIMDSESGKVLHEIQAGFDIVTGEFLLQGFDDIVRLPNSSRCDPSHWELIDVGEFRVNAMSTAETYDEIQITDSTHMSSLLDSLSTRVNDGIAQIREIEETLNQKYDLLFHCDSLLESFSNIFVSNHLQQSFLTKRNLRTNRSIENLIPLLSDTPVISNEDVDDRPPKDRNELQILDAKMIYGGINNYDKVFLDISVINNSCKDLHSIHLVAYPKNSSVSSSMIRVHSPYINVLAAGQKDNISILIDLPLDHLLYGLELGVILWYQIIDNSTLDKKYDEIGWHSIYIEKIRSPNTMKNDLDKFLPSATYFMFNNSISLHKQWDLTMLPFILEQYLGVESSFLNNASHEFRTTDGSCWLRLFRPYKCPSPDTCENEISINITRQLMEIRSHDDKNLTFMTKILCRELSGGLVVSVPSPLFYSELSVYDGLDDFFFAVEDLLKTDCLASQHDVVMDRSIKRLLCAKLANWLFAL